MQPVSHRKEQNMNNILEYLELTEQKYPSHTAVDDGNFVFTWKELGELSRRIGTAFARKIQPGKPIVIFEEKSSVTLAAMLGAVYAGCFYVALNPEQPPQRIQEILRVLEPELIVVGTRTKEILSQTDYNGLVVFLKDAMQEDVNEETLREIRTNSRDTDILYGMFTSGSTGTPKGIVVSHRAAIDFITHFTQIFGITVQDRIGNQAPFDFDVSIKDIYSSIFTGAALMILPKEMFSTPTVLLEYLSEKKVTTLIWAVSALCMVSALKGLSCEVPLEINKVLFSGEVMPVKQLRMWQAVLPHAEFVNLYGPTEITCNCTYHRVEEMMMDGEKIPIGKAFPGRKVFLIDETGKEIHMPGVSGEICVTGESLSEGYYHNPEETGKRFMVYPAHSDSAVRCYKTGDLGYYGEKGELYFSGRKDFQIKHMGHRIELEEIERAMEQVSGLDRGLCLMDEKRNRLVAFYLGDISPEQIRKQMKSKLPVYMIPHKLIQTTSMPLNKNGKTDRSYFRKKLG